MKHYILEMELLSETIFGSGEAIPGSVDSEIVYDEVGLPYLKGKTLKGVLREEANNIVSLSNGYFENKDIEKIFGKVDNDEINKVAFSHCKVKDNISNLIEKAVTDRNSVISKEDIFEAVTDIRYFTAINEKGIAKKGTLRELRTINRGLVFTAKINILEELSEKEEMLLAMAVSSLKHVGMMRNRGKGNIRCTLSINNKEINSYYIDKYMGEEP